MTTATRCGSEEATRYRADIDGLRAIAVGSVIVNHFDPGVIPSGYLGVDIFFVISGYVITLSLHAHQFETLADFLLGFYARRFKRIMPALILCVAVTSVVTGLFNPEPAESLKTGLCALFGCANLYLLRIANDYFGGPSQLNSFTQTWSLGVEEQFYVLFPVILRLALQLPGRAGARIFCVVMLATATLSLVLFAGIGVYHRWWRSTSCRSGSGNWLPAAWSRPRMSHAHPRRGPTGAGKRMASSS